MHCHSDRGARYGDFFETFRLPLCNCWLNSVYSEQNCKAGLYFMSETPFITLTGKGRKMRKEVGAGKIFIGWFWN